MEDLTLRGHECQVVEVGGPSRGFPLLLDALADVLVDVGEVDREGGGEEGVYREALELPLDGLQLPLPPDLLLPELVEERFRDLQSLGCFLEVDLEYLRLLGLLREIPAQLLDFLVEQADLLLFLLQLLPGARELLVELAQLLREGLDIFEHLRILDERLQPVSLVSFGG